MRRANEHLSSTDPEQRTVLLELVHIEFEYRLKAGDAVQVEDYLREYPELAVVDDGSSDEMTCPSCGSSFNVAQDHAVSWDSQRLPSMGKFQLLSAVGRGAFGTVYRARDTELDRVVAVKIPRSGQLADRDDEDRFLREARSAAQLCHPGIVPVYEVGRGGDFPYLVSEFVDGVTLASLLTGRSFSFLESADLMAQVADAHCSMPTTRASCIAIRNRRTFCWKR